MERLDSKLYEKYTALKKRKLLDEGLQQKREAAHKELHDAMKDRVSGLQKDKEELSEKLADKEDELEKARQDFLEDIWSRDSEILKLKQLMAEMTEKNNSTATVDRTPEAILENPNPISPKRNAPQSDSNANRAQLSENATVHQSSPDEVSPELECSRRHTCISGVITVINTVGTMKYEVDNTQNKYYLSQKRGRGLHLKNLEGLHIKASI